MLMKQKQYGTDSDIITAASIINYQGMYICKFP